MSREQLTAAALALPPDERAELAQTLWESIQQGEAERREVAEAALVTVRCRAAAHRSGEATGRPREEVMAAARRAIGCE